MNTTVSILKNTEEFIFSVSSEGVRTKRDVNNGWCIAFAEGIENELESVGYSHTMMLTNDYLVESEEQLDSSYILHFDLERMNMYGITESQYEAYRKKILDTNSEGVIGYHAWLYDKKTKKHYDIEHPAGADNVFDLPFFVRQHHR